MIINNNMNAIIAHRNMVNNMHKSGKSMRKLSSGLRINKAGDDAAGLAISEKMRGQIRGLDQSVRNAQDGISLIQIAEGALNETHSILQRMRELAGQAANDTNTSEDRKQIQNEINQLTSEVNRIGNTTEFNTIKLLDKSPAAPLGVKLKFIEEMKSGWLGSAEKLLEATYGITGKNSMNKGEVFVNYYFNAGKDGRSVAGESKDGKVVLNVDLKNFYSDKMDDTERSRVIAKEFTKAVMLDTLEEGVMFDAPKSFVDGLADLVIGGDSLIKKLASDNTMTAEGYNVEEINKIAKHAIDLLEGTVQWKSPEMYKYDEASAYVFMQCIAQNATNPHHEVGKPLGSPKVTSNMVNFIKDFNDVDAIKAKTGKSDIDFIDALEYTVIKNTKYDSISQMTLSMKSNFLPDRLKIPNVEIDLAYFIINKGVYGDTASVGDVGGVNTKIMGMKVNWDKALDDDEGAYIGSNFGNPPNPAKSKESIISNTTLKEQPLANYKTEFTNPYMDTAIMAIEAGGGINIQLEDMRGRALNLEGNEGGKVVAEDGARAYYTTISAANGVTNGINGEVTGQALDIRNYEKATAAISVLDDAIEKVSNQRSALGSIQNRLEHTINNLNNASENLTAAESRVRDVDMAKEMMTFSKDNILQQSAQAMLAQAKQAPQGILQLLR